jgi:hypothetical protein
MNEIAALGRQRTTIAAGRSHDAYGAGEAPSRVRGSG